MFWLKFGHLLQSVAVNEAFKFHAHFEDRWNNALNALQTFYATNTNALNQKQNTLLMTTTTMAVVVVSATMTAASAAAVKECIEIGKTREK